MITMKGRCMKPRPRSRSLKQKGRSTWRAQTRFLLCLQQEFGLEIWLSWQTSTFVLPEVMCVLRDIQTHPFDWCAMCLWKWDAIVAPVFSSPIGVHRCHFLNHPVSLGLVTSKYVSLQTPETNMGTWRLIIPLRFPTGISSSKGSIFDWRSSRSPRILPVQCAMTEGWLVDLTAFTSRHETPCVYWYLIQVLNSY